MSNKLTRNELHADIVKKIDDSATKLELQSVSDSLTSVTGSVSTHVADQNAHGITSKVTTLNSQISAVDASLVAHNSKGIPDGVHGLATTGDLTYYVRPDGSNSNNGLANSSASAFKTIQYAISKIPQIVNHSITIRLLEGSYAESVVIAGFGGIGQISLRKQTTGAVFVDAVSVLNSTLPIEAQGLTVTSQYGVTVSRCTDVTISDFNVVGNSSGYNGFTISKSYVHLTSTVISNKGMAASVSDNSLVKVGWNSGSGNTTVYGSYFASTIIKINQEHPTGSTAQYTQGGGVVITG